MAVRAVAASGAVQGVTAAASTAAEAVKGFMARIVSGLATGYAWLIGTFTG